MLQTSTSMKAEVEAATNGHDGESGVEEAPCVRSLIEGRWTPRPCHEQTPQRLATCISKMSMSPPSPSSSVLSTSSPTMRDGTQGFFEPTVPHAAMCSSTSCSPIIIQERYILSVVTVSGSAGDSIAAAANTGNGNSANAETRKVCFLLHELSIPRDPTSRTKTEPIHRLVVDYDVSIIQCFCHTLPSHSQDSDETLMIAALSTEGYVFLLVLRDGASVSSPTNRNSSSNYNSGIGSTSNTDHQSTHESASVPKLELNYVWHTDRVGASNFAVRLNLPTSERDHPSISVHIGYQSNHIECWLIVAREDALESPYVRTRRPLKKGSMAKTNPPTTRDTFLFDRPDVVQIWSGLLDGPIRALYSFTFGQDATSASIRTKTGKADSFHPPANSGASTTAQAYPRSLRFPQFINRKGSAQHGHGHGHGHGRGNGHPGQGQGQGNVIIHADMEKDDAAYLIVIIQSTQNESRAPKSAAARRGSTPAKEEPICRVEMINLESVLSAWNQLQKEMNGPQHVTLMDHAVQQEVGTNATSKTSDSSISTGHGGGGSTTSTSTDGRARNQSSSTRLPPLVPCVGSDVIRTVHGDSSSHRCGVTMSDGSVLFLIATKTKNNGASWGTSHEVDRNMLMYPSIGCGIAAVRGKTKHMICCTRSGTVFIIPAHKAHQPISESTILTTSYPEDTDFDSPATYVQSFQAGNLLLKHGSERVKLPVLIFGWTNGIMDVYACRLLPSSLIEDSTTVAATQMKPTVPVEQQVLIEDCWENGSIELLFQLLEHLQDDPNNPLLRDPMWKAALAEFVELSDYPDSMVDVMMESEMYPAMRSTLLSLSTVSD